MTTSALSRRLLGSVLLGVGLACGVVAAQTTAPTTLPTTLPHMNLDLPFAERARLLVRMMTLEEKASQLQARVPENRRLEIAPLNWWGEAVHGLRGGPATVFPHAIAMGATWDPPLIGRISTAISDEARARRGKSLMLWCPLGDMARDPRWGRCQETYGEDPLLTSRMAVEFVKGLQGNDPKYIKTVATPKHFAAYSQETGRTTLSVAVSERTLRDYYLPGFQACVMEGKALSVMASFNAINSVPCAGNRWLLTDLLRKEWGFEGAVVTDNGAVGNLFLTHRVATSLDAAAAMGVHAGVDVMSVGRSLEENIVAAVKAGLLPEAELDQALTRNLIVRFRLGLFDPPEKVPYTSIPASVVGRPSHVALALQCARESIVLLQNDAMPPGHGFERLLPLDLRRIGSIAVVGPYAARPVFGNYSPSPANPPVTALDGLTAAVGPRVQVRTADWENEEAALRVVRSSDVVVVVMGLAETMEGEGRDRITLDLPPKQLEFLKKVTEANPATVVVLMGGSAIAMAGITDVAPAVMMAWYSGEQGGAALAEVLLGQYSPSGRLPMTFYKNLADLPPINDYEIDRGRTYMYHEKPVSFPFGHGLSFASFRYADLKLSSAAVTTGDRVTVTFDLSNASAVAADEVVQLYVRKEKSPIKRPLKQLKGFQRVAMAARQSRVVTMDLSIADLGFWDVAAQKRIVEPGSYEIMVGSSSADIRLRGVLEVK